jgi:hypothetical protein
MRRLYLVLAILGIGLLLSFPKSTARADFGFPVVFNATVDTTANTLTIAGVNFGANPTVTLGGSQQLSVQSFNSSQIVANLPANLAPGDYLLIVRFGNWTFAVFEVTIGAVGPPGPAGSGGGGDHLYQAQVPSSQAVASTIPLATVASLTVPAGSYLITGKTWVENGDGQSSNVGCFLLLGTGIFPFDSTSTSLAAGQIAALALQNSGTFSQPTTITLGCLEAVPGVGISASNTVLSALSVGAIN